MSQHEPDNIFSGFFAEKMSEYNIPGAVFALVEDGAVVVSAGYGFSSVERELRVDPDRTTFPLSAVSGLFTVITMLQLVEEGLVGISDDVSNFLPDFRVPRSRHGQPVVMNLLNHTDGFAECLLWSAVSDPARRLRLDQFINKSMEPTVCEPGRLITSGCLSMAIAGYIIEVAAGDTYEEYIKERVFDPLGMNSTAFESLPDNHLTGEAAVPYEFFKGDYEPLAGFYSNAVPASGAMTTGSDMGRFLVSLLSGGSGGSRGILQMESLERVLEKSKSPAPGLPGVTCGFFERRVNGVRILERAGGTPGTCCAVYLAPELNTGFFLAINRRDERIQEDLIRLVTGDNRGNNETSPGDDDATPDLHEYCGQFHYVQRSRKTITRYLSLSKNLLRVEIDEAEPGSLKVIPLAFGDTLGGFHQVNKWQPVGGDLFADGKDGLIAFIRDEGGIVSDLCAGQELHGCYERTHWYESPGFFSAIAGIYLIIFLLVALISPTWFFTSIGPERWPVVLLMAAALLNIVFIAGIQPAVNRKGKTGLLLLCYSDHIDPLLACLLAITILGATLSALLAVFTAIAWGWAYWSVSMRFFYTACSVLSVSFVLFLSRLKLLGYRF